MKKKKTELLSQDETTQWSTVKRYFSVMLPDYKLTRTDFLRCMANSSCDTRTAEVYRCYLTRAGYLKWVRPGVYARAKKIPIGLTVEQCQDEAYPQRVQRRVKRHSERQQREKEWTAQGCLT